jgi:hypothetical protein
MDVKNWMSSYSTSTTSHTNVQFDMETERDGHSAILVIDIYRRPDNFLGHRVYRKLTHTNLYLSATCHHYPADKQLCCPAWFTGPRQSVIQPDFWRN